MEKHLDQDTVYTKFKHKQIVRIMEKLRDANDRLRESGHYWHQAAKDLYNKRK